jgi:hypothetical protein
VFERLDAPVALPKFYVMTVHETLGVLFRDVIIWTHKLDRPEKVAINADNVGSILGHLSPRAQWGIYRA